MEYLVIVLVIAVALAPLSHFVPSKAQRKIARLREYAAINGLYVEFRDLPGVEAKTRVESSGRNIYYGRRVRARAMEGGRRRVWVCRDNRWSAVPRGPSVPEVLAELPVGILAVSADLDSCGIYWQETGDEAEIDRILQVLDALADKIYQ